MKELLVKCSLCEDEFHTTNEIGGMEVCTVCDDVFYIQESDIVDKSNNDFQKKNEIER